MQTRNSAEGTTRLEFVFETLPEPAVADSNGRRRTFPNALANELKLVRRTAVCGSACTVVWGAPSEMTAPTRFLMAFGVERHGRSPSQEQSC